MDTSRREMITMAIVYAGRQNSVPLFTGLFLYSFLKNETKQNTPLQNCNMVEVANVLWRSSCPTLLLMQGHLPRAGCRGSCPERAFRKSPSTETPQPLWTTTPKFPMSWDDTKEHSVYRNEVWKHTHFWRGLIISIVKKTAFYLEKYQVISVPKNKIQTV